MIIHEFQRVWIGGMCEEWCLFRFVIEHPTYYPTYVSGFKMVQGLKKLCKILAIFLPGQGGGPTVGTTRNLLK